LWHFPEFDYAAKNSPTPSGDEQEYGNVLMFADKTSDKTVAGMLSFY
jgi:hypothetical protein